MTNKTRSSRRPFILIFPPAAYPERPVLALATLAGFLRDKGVEVYLEDLNLEACHFHLKPERFDLYRELIKRNLSNPHIPDQWKMNAIKILVVARDLKKNINQAIKILQHKKLYYDPSKRKWALDTVKLGTKMVSTAYYPVEWNWGVFNCGFRYSSSAEILAAAQTPDSTPFTEFFQYRVEREIIPKNPLLIGISISFQDQIIPAFRLLKIIKGLMPEVHCTVGGAVITRLVEEISQTKALFSLSDSFVVNEGETALWRLYQALLHKKSLKKIPNLIYKVADKINVNHFYYEKFEELPQPSFDGFHLMRYLLPETVLHLETSRGCYWRKCTFCNLPKINLQRKHRSYRPERIVQMIEELTARYNSRWINFWDEAVPPANLRSISQGILDRNIPVQWHAVVSFDSSLDRPLLELMAKAGCRALSFGLESAHPRIQKLMNKKNDLDLVNETLKNCRECDIHVHFTWFVGFPGETRAEASATLNFLLDNLKNDEYAWHPGYFILYKHSIIAQYPQRFGIKIIRDPTADLAIEIPYITESGLSQKEAMELGAEFIKPLKYRGLGAEARYGSPYLLYQSHFGKTHPDFYPRKSKAKTLKNIKTETKPVLAYGVRRETIKVNLQGGETEYSLVVYPKNNSVVIVGESEEIDFWLEEIDGVKTIGQIKHGFQQKFNSPWLGPYLELIDLGMIET